MFKSLYYKCLTLLKRHREALLSGVLLGLSAPPLPPVFLAFCFVPLWAKHLGRSTSMEFFKATLITISTGCLIGFYWVFYTLKDFGGLPSIAAFIGLLLYVSFLQLALPFAAALSARFRQASSLHPPTLSLILLHVFLSTLIFHSLPQLFPWNLGLFWMTWNLSIMQYLEYFGLEALSVLTFILNGLILYLWQSRKNHSFDVKKWSLGLVAVVILVNFSGGFLKPNLEEITDSLNVRIVQDNLSQRQRYQLSKKGDPRILALKKNLSATQATNLDSIDLIVWPEVATPELFRNPLRFNYRTQNLKDFLMQYRVPLITGSYGTLDNKRRTNAASLFKPHAETLKLEQAHKSRLLAFGEYFPFSQQFPVLKKWFPMVADFDNAPEPQVLKLDQLKLGIQICYESTFSGFARSLAIQGAHVFVNLSNDSWYGTLMEPYQHLYYSKARSLEFRTPVIRSTNTGFSTVVNIDGSFEAISPLNQEWVQDLKVRFNTNRTPTFYAHSGWWLIIMFQILGLLLSFYFSVVRKKSKKKP